MDKKEIAYNLTKVLVDKRYYFSTNCTSSQDFAKEIAKIFNAIYKNISAED